LHELGADRRRIAQDVREICTRTQRVDVRMLLQEEVVVGGAFVERALQRFGVAVRDRAEPTGVQRRHGHASSASQSRVSSTLRISFKNEAAYAPSNARWSQERERNPTWCTTIASSPSGPSITTGSLRMPSVARIATWGWLMIANVCAVPKGPM